MIVITQQIHSRTVLRASADVFLILFDMR